jgi:hypothetical protein
VISPAGTFQSKAAAAISISFAAAPALRSCTVESAPAVDPPVPRIAPDM